jgi:hypothetical protein
VGIGDEAQPVGIFRRQDHGHDVNLDASARSPFP